MYCMYKIQSLCFFNNDRGFLFDASDVITRDAWVEAISSAIPVTKKESPSHSAQ